MDPQFENHGLRNLNLYDRLASIYASDRNEVFYKKVARLIDAPWVRPTSGNALDLGCGMGFSTEVLADLAPAAHWIAIDPSSELIDRAKLRLGSSRVHFVVGTAESLPFSSGSFDWVTSSLSFHWFGPGAERELFRVVAPGGRVSLTIPLLGPDLKDSGNELLRRWVLRNRRTLLRRTSQGLTWKLLRERFSEWKIITAEETRIRETFADSADLKNTLETRGAWEAIFDHDFNPAFCGGPLSFTWKIGVIHLIRPGLSDGLTDEMDSTRPLG